MLSMDVPGWVSPEFAGHGGGALPVYEYSPSYDGGGGDWIAPANPDGIDSGVMFPTVNTPNTNQTPVTTTPIVTGLPPLTNDLAAQIKKLQAEQPLLLYGGMALVLYLLLK